MFAVRARRWLTGLCSYSDPQTATAAYTFVRSLAAAEKEAQAVREQAAARFPRARAFKLASEDEAAAGSQEDPNAGKEVVEE